MAASDPSPMATLLRFVLRTMVPEELAYAVVF